MPKQAKHEHRIDIRVFVRAKDSQAAAQFAEKINKLIADEVTGNFLKYKVSLTGNRVELVEDIDA